MNSLLELTLRGSVAALLIVIVDRSLAGRIRAASRRVWWCLLPLAFLAPVHLPGIPAFGPLAQVGGFAGRPQIEIPAGAHVAAAGNTSWVAVISGVWLAGALAYLAVVAIQTVRAGRRWAREPLTTDSSLLSLLESCKEEASVRAPIGLVVSSTVASPAILGWFRPRILLPDSLAYRTPSPVLRAIFLHELAHYRWYDVPFNWLMAAVRAMHWFNPLAHVGAAYWTLFREEAADEAAVTWMKEDSARAYGDALVCSLRQGPGTSVPFGSLAIVESVNQIKRRIYMISHYKDKSPRALLTGVVAILVAAVVCSISARASDAVASDPKDAVVAVSKMWLKQLDEAQYERAYDSTGAWFHQLCTVQEWVPEMAEDAYKMGKCTLHQQSKEARFETEPAGSKTAGEWAYVEFKSSFEKGPQKTQLVVLKKEADGAWKVAGYSIGDPKP